ncbi:hypothetical protein HDV00_010502 [Rhizophlyctis rosea]|nr:hypothetical protein HDV00_010502 [Rhizophlyctis rosea]
MTNPPLAPEIYLIIAHLAGPKGSRKLRNTNESFRALITMDDLNWAEAGWRLSQYGVDDCWEWASLLWQTKVLKPLLMDVGLAMLRRALGQAARRGDTEWVRILLGKYERSTEKDLDPCQYVDRPMMQPVPAASFGGHVEILRSLLAASKRSLYPAHEKTDALEFAASKGHVEVINALLAAGTNVNSWWIDPLREAAMNGHVHAVKVLVKAGANNEQCEVAMREAAGEGHVEVVKVLLAASRDVPRAATLALIAASGRDHSKVVELVLGVGVEIDTHRALCCAAKNGRLGTAEMLLEAGASVTVGNTCALDFATMAGHVSMVDLFLRHGARSDRALWNASCSGKTEIAKLLLEHGTDMGSFPRRFQLLAMASWKGHKDVVQVFLEREWGQYEGLYRAVQVYDGGNRECWDGHHSYIEVLDFVDHKARGMVVDESLLDWAVTMAIARGHIKSLILLLKAGEDRYETEFDDLEMAFCKQHRGILALLKFLMLEDSGGSDGFASAIMGALSVGLLYRHVNTMRLSMMVGWELYAPLRAALQVVGRSMAGVSATMCAIDWDGKKPDFYIPSTRSRRDWDDWMRHDTDDATSNSPSTSDTGVNDSTTGKPIPSKKRNSIQSKFEKFFGPDLSIVETAYRKDPFPRVEKMKDLAKDSKGDWYIVDVAEWFEWKNGGRRKGADGSGELDGGRETNVVGGTDEAMA